MRLPHLLLLLPLLTACGPTVVYEDSHPLPDTGWAYADSARFAFAIPDTTINYDYVLTLEHSPEFAYQNFYVRFHTGYPSGVRKTEEVSLQLAGDFGVWHGECSGTSCELEIPILRNARFAAAGDYVLTVEQFSRENPLTGVAAVGLRVEETAAP